jgi:Plant specific mitochondrial import receptor subunit TOM20
LFDQAREKLEQAAAIDVDSESTFLNWGRLLVNDAARKTGEEARLVLSEAHRRYEHAIEIAAGNADSRLDCVTALWLLAEFADGNHAQELLKRAKEHWAAAMEIQPESAAGWDTSGNYVDGASGEGRASGSARVARASQIEVFAG